MVKETCLRNAVLAFCRYKGTIICQEVAKAKNVCQVRLNSKSSLNPVQIAINVLASLCCSLQRVEEHHSSKLAICFMQVCLLDLDYNLPVQVRDQALGVEDEALPESDVGREFALERMANEGELEVGYNKAKANDTILKLQRTAPYYQAG